MLHLNALLNRECQRPWNLYWRQKTTQNTETLLLSTLECRILLLYDTLQHHGGCCMYARPHTAKIITEKQRLSLVLSFIPSGLYDDECDLCTLTISKSIHRSQGLSNTKPFKPVRQWWSLKLKNLGSELGVRSNLILFTEHLFITLTEMRIKKRMYLIPGTDFSKDFQTFVFDG